MARKIISESRATQGFRIVCFFFPFFPETANFQRKLAEPTNGCCPAGPIGVVTNLENSVPTWNRIRFRINKLKEAREVPPFSNAQNSALPVRARKPGLDACKTVAVRLEQGVHVLIASLWFPSRGHVQLQDTASCSSVSLRWSL